MESHSEPLTSFYSRDVRINRKNKRKDTQHRSVSDFKTFSELVWAGVGGEADAYYWWWTPFKEVLFPRWLLTWRSVSRLRAQLNTNSWVLFRKQLQCDVVFPLTDAGTNKSNSLVLMTTWPLISSILASLRSDRTRMCESVSTSIRPNIILLNRLRNCSNTESSAGDSGLLQLHVWVRASITHDSPAIDHRSVACLDCKKTTEENKGKKQGCNN